MSRSRPLPNCWMHERVGRLGEDNEMEELYDSVSCQMTSRARYASLYQMKFLEAKRLKYIK